jgi:hypothetical protein
MLLIEINDELSSIPLIPALRWSEKHVLFFFFTKNLFLNLFFIQNTYTIA